MSTIKEFLIDDHKKYDELFGLSGVLMIFSQQHLSADSQRIIEMMNAIIAQKN